MKAEIEAAHRHTDKTGRQAGRQAGSQSVSQAGRQAGEQAGGESDRQTGIHTKSFPFQPLLKNTISIAFSNLFFFFLRI